MLSIGVGSFEEGTEEELGFVAGRVEEVAKAFERLAATVDLRLDLDEDEIEALLRERLVKDPGPADVLVVHLVGHGRVDRGSRLSFVARDDRDVDVDRWIEKAQREVERGGARRRVVFLVDTCSAGTATGRQPFTELDVERGVWALGACVGDTPTERGRFSGWIAAALHRLADRDFTLDEEAISFERFVREVIRVNRKDAAGLRLSVGFHLEQGDADWPFLPNPRVAGLSDEQRQACHRSLGYVPGEGDPQASAAAGHPVDDSPYFTDRASGRGLVPADAGTGFFSGRAAELEHCARWVADRGRLLIVTGAAGAGKSGLLGVVVCAADPGLRQRFRELWESAGQKLPEVPGVVAVHARQRSAQQVVEAIASAAGLVRPQREPDTAGSGAPGDGASAPWSVRLLRAALAEEGRDRLIVLDAVDESTEPQAVLRLVAALLAPGADSPAPCRILLGGRREVVTSLYALEEADHIDDDRIDLDAAEPLAVEQDVHRYIHRMLRAREPYATGPAAEFVELLANRGARNIVRGARPDDPWGPFLLAGLYVHYLLTLKYPPRDEAGADAYARTASSDLPALLESILKTRRHDFPALRAVLAVLARSRGDGMPRTVLRRCVRALGVEEIGEEQLSDTLREASPFLRYGTDPQSGETLYRLFHQGLADYLHDHPVSEDPLEARESLALEQRLLEEVVGPFVTGTGTGTREDPWEAAEDEPYVLRHALGHAARAESVEYAEALLSDPYFVVRFPLHDDQRAMDLVRSERATRCLRLLSASWATHAGLRSASDRAAVFAFDADRLGMHALRKRFQQIARQLAVRPQTAAAALRWAYGGEVESGSRSIQSSTQQVQDIAFSPDGGLLALGGWEGVRLFETQTWKPADVLGKRDLGGTVTALAFSPDGRFLAVGSATLRRSVQLWDVRNRVYAGPPWNGRTGTVTSLAFSPDSCLLAVGSRGHGVSVWDVTGERPAERVRREPDEDVRDVEEVRGVAFSPDGRLLAVCGTAGVTVWDRSLERWTVWGHESSAAVAFSPDGRFLAAATLKGVALCTVEPRALLAMLKGVSGTPRGLAFTPDGAHLVVAVPNSLTVVEPATGRVVNRLRADGGRLTCVAVDPVTGVPVSGDAQGRLRLWKDFTEEPPDTRLPWMHAESVVGSPDGRFLAVHDNERNVLTLRDVATGQELASRRLGTLVDYFTWSPDGRTLVAVGFSELHVLRTGSRVLLPEPEVVHLGAAVTARPLSFSADGRRFALALAEPYAHVLLVWDSETLRLCARVPLAGRPAACGFAGSDHVWAVVNGAVGSYALTATPPLEESPV